MVCFSATFSLSGTYRCWKQRQHKLLAPCQQSRLCRVGSLCRAQCPNYRGADCKAETCKPLHANMFQQGKQHTWQKAQLGRSPANFAQVLSSSLGAAEGHLSAMGSHCLSALTDESRPFSCHNSCSDQARLIKYSVPASSSSLSQQWGVTLMLFCSVPFLWWPACALCFALNTGKESQVDLSSPILYGPFQWWVLGPKQSVCCVFL